MKSMVVEKKLEKMVTQKKWGFEKRILKEEKEVRERCKNDRDIPPVKGVKFSRKSPLLRVLSILSVL